MGAKKRTALRSSAQAIDVFCQLRLVVRSFFLVNHVSLSQAVQHGRYAGQQLFRLFRRSRVSQFLDRIPRSFCLVPVSQAFRRTRPDPLEC